MSKTTFYFQDFFNLLFSPDLLWQFDVDGKDEVWFKKKKKKEIQHVVPLCSISTSTSTFSS